MYVEALMHEYCYNSKLNGVIVARILACWCLFVCLRSNFEGFVYRIMNMSIFRWYFRFCLVASTTPENVSNVHRAKSLDITLDDFLFCLQYYADVEVLYQQSINQKCKQCFSVELSKLFVQIFA